jgi:hypothetical protein
MTVRDNAQLFHAKFTHEIEFGASRQFTPDRSKTASMGLN